MYTARVRTGVRTPVLSSVKELQDKKILGLDRTLHKGGGRGTALNRMTSWIIPLYVCMKVKGCRPFYIPWPRRDGMGCSG